MIGHPVTLPHGSAAATPPGWRRALARHPALAIAALAILLRLLLFLGRGDYIAFDEGWYLLLARSLWAGHGYTLSGLRHTALSPLFPIAAGGVARLVGSLVWGGRIVAAVASGLLVLPCWSIFRRLAGRRTALISCGMVAVLPSLAPFVAPYWIGWDLWVGAGPLGYLFLLTGIALVLAAGDGWGRWALAGGAFGLAFLDRPEAILAAALVAAASLGLAARRRRAVLGRAARLVLLGAVFGLVTAPYFLYLHDALGRWALTGRGVAVGIHAVARTATEGATTGERTIEQMLWEGEDHPYARQLYRLDPSDTRMANAYWGVPPREASRSSGERSAGAVVRADRPLPAAPGVLASAAPRAAASSTPVLLQRALYFIRAMGVVAPWFLWPFILAGVLAPGHGRRRELVAFAPLAVTAVAIGLLVAIDPRTQIILAPALAWYAARGLRLGAVELRRRSRGLEVERGFQRRLVVAVTLLILLGTDARRLYLSLTVGSVGQVVAKVNHEVGVALRGMVPPDEPVMSWSPAVAVWADRDWRVLPTASLERVMRYAGAVDTRWLVFSTVNPAPLPRARMPRAFLLLHLGAGTAAAHAWKLEVTAIHDQYAVGTFGPEAGP